MGLEGPTECKVRRVRWLDAARMRAPPDSKFVAVCGEDNIWKHHCEQAACTAPIEMYELSSTASHDQMSSAGPPALRRLPVHCAAQTPSQGAVIEMKMPKPEPDSSLLLAYSTGSALLVDVTSSIDEHGVPHAQLRSKQLWTRTLTEEVTGMDALGTHYAICGDGGLVAVFGMDGGWSNAGGTQGPLMQVNEPYAINAVAMIKSHDHSEWGSELATVCSGGYLKIWDAGAGRGAEAQRFHFSNDPRQGHDASAALTSVAVRPATGGHHIITGSACGYLTLWDRRHAAEPISHLQSHENSIWEIRFCRASTTDTGAGGNSELFTCSDDGTVVHHSIRDLHAAVGVGPQDTQWVGRMIEQVMPINGIDIDDDGLLVAGTDGMSINLISMWDNDLAHETAATTGLATSSFFSNQDVYRRTSMSSIARGGGNSRFADQSFGVASPFLPDPSVGARTPFSIASGTRPSPMGGGGFTPNY